MNRKHQRGQGMTEYIIVVALIAIAAIGVFSFYGDTAKNQTAALARELAGESGVDATAMAERRSETAELRARNNSTLKGFSNN